MKKRKLFLAALLSMALCFAAAACGGKGGDGTPGFQLGENTSVIWLDRYSEADVPLSSGDAAALTWTSADESVVTVSAGRLSAQGEGETTVTVTDGVTTAVITVRVSDSGALPVISVDDFDAYVDADIDIPAVLRYNGEEMAATVEYTAEIEDTSVAMFVGGKIRGISLGQTDAVIRATYKGLDLQRRCVITVRENSLVDFGGPVDLYAVVGNDDLSTVVLTPDVIVTGQKVADAAVSYRIAEGDGVVSLDAATGTVTALAEGEAVIEGTFDNNGTPVTGRVAVTVHPNWVAGSFINGSLYDITWQPATGTVGGRQAAGTDMMEYRAPDDFVGASYWEYRVSGADTGTLLTDLYRKGYRYFAYDVYYTSDQNFYMGTGRGPQTVLVGEFFRRDYVQVFCDTDGDGVQEVTNRVDKNVWMTFSFDLLALIEANPSYTSEFFFTVNDNISSSYIMNVRYYLDGAFIPDENLVYTDMGTYTQATEDEFDVANPVSSGYANLATTGKCETEIKEGECAEYGPYDGTVGGRTGVYRYAPHTDNAWKNNLVVASSMNKSYDLGLTKLYSRGHYLTFDVYIEKATTLSTSLNHTATAAVITLGKTDLSAYADWLNVIKDGKRQYTMQAGEWYTVSLGFKDAYTPGSWRATIYFASGNAGDVLYIDNVRYEKTGDFLPAEYEGFAPPKGVEAPHPDTMLETEAEGQYAGKIKYTSYNSGTGWDNHAASVRFTGVTVNNTAAGDGDGAADYFKAGYKYVKLDFLLADNATGFGFYSWATFLGQYGVQHAGDMSIGDSNTSRLFLFDADTKALAETLEGNKWYTLFIPTEYTGSETPDWAIIEFRSTGGSADNPAVVYLDNIEFTFDTYEMPALDYEITGVVNDNNTQSWTLTDVTEGPFAGWKKFDSDQNQWYQSLELISANNLVVYQMQARYITMRVSFDGNVKSLMYYDDMFTQNVTHAETHEIGVPYEGAEWLRFYDADGNEVTEIEAGETYTMCVKVGQSAWVGWGSLKLQLTITDAAIEAGERGAMYFTDVELHENDPFAG